MKKYRIPINYQCVKVYEIEAKNLQQAVGQALEQFFEEEDDNYIADSYCIDRSVDDAYPDEDYSEI